jgi:hypothetical protein
MGMPDEPYYICPVRSDSLRYWLATYVMVDDLDDHRCRTFGSACDGCSAYPRGIDGPCGI